MEKLSFFKKILISIKDLDKYNLLITEKLRKSIIYFLELMLIFTIILSLVMTYKINNLISNVIDYTKNSIPEFTINENELNIQGDTPVIAENKEIVAFKVILDDENETIDNYKEEIENYKGSVVVLLKNKIIIVSDNREIERTYKEIISEGGIEGTEITKTNLLNTFEQNKSKLGVGIFIALFGANYLLYTFSTLIDILALSLLVIIISKMAKIALKYSQCITIAIHSITLPILLNLIYSCANVINGFYMTYFQIMYTLISYIYIVAVILIMKSDLIKKKQLIKATIEVKKMEQEQEKKENEDKEKKEKKEKKENKTSGKEKENKKGEKEPLEDVKGRIKNKLKKDKDNPEPQANIEGGKQ